MAARFWTAATQRSGVAASDLRRSWSARNREVLRRGEAKAVTSPTSSPQSKTLARCSHTPRSCATDHGVFASGVLAGERGVASHTFTAPSWLADTNHFPSGLNATLSIHSVCPFNVSGSGALVVSHTFNVLSPLAEVNRLPAERHTTHATRWCVLSTLFCLGVTACYIRRDFVAFL